MLPRMRYKSFLFPHNPRIYSIAFSRDLARHKVPMGAYLLQDLGRSCRVLRGEGEFYGPRAYEKFKELASLFYDGEPGELYHPIWQSSRVYFTQLELRQEPRENYVAYRFTFCEGYFGYGGLKTVAAPTPSGASGASVRAVSSGAVYHTVKPGDTLWAIARTYGLDLAALLKQNPGISNPNLIRAGEKVRVK